MGPRGRAGAAAGNASVEFGVVGACFVMLVMFAVESAWQFATAAGLDHGARGAARWAATGAAAPDGASREQEVARRIVETSGLPLERARLTVALENADALATLDAPGGTRPGLGGGGATVRYRVSYEAPLLTPPARLVLARGALIHRLTVIARSEPYGG